MNFPLLVLYEMERCRLFRLKLLDRQNLVGFFQTALDFGREGRTGTPDQGRGTRISGLNRLLVCTGQERET